MFFSCEAFIFFQIHITHFEYIVSASASASLSFMIPKWNKKYDANTDLCQAWFTLETNSSGHIIHGAFLAFHFIYKYDKNMAFMANAMGKIYRLQTTEGLIIFLSCFIPFIQIIHEQQQQQKKNRVIPRQSLRIDNFFVYCFCTWISSVCVCVCTCFIYNSCWLKYFRPIRSRKLRSQQHIIHLLAMNSHENPSYLRKFHIHTEREKKSSLRANIKDRKRTILTAQE